MLFSLLQIESTELGRRERMFVGTVRSVTGNWQILLSFPTCFAYLIAVSLVIDKILFGCLDGWLGGFVFVLRFYKIYFLSVVLYIPLYGSSSSSLRVPLRQTRESRRNIIEKRGYCSLVASKMAATATSLLRIHHRRRRCSRPKMYARADILT